jgi:hypothetical protein
MEWKGRRIFDIDCLFANGQCLREEKKRTRPSQTAFSSLLSGGKLDRAVDATGLQRGTHATGADVEALLDTVDDEAFVLDVRLERSVGASLGEADVVPEAFVFAADFALTGHVGIPF